MPAYTRPLYFDLPSAVSSPNSHLCSPFSNTRVTLPTPSHPWSPILPTEKTMSTLPPAARMIHSPYLWAPRLSFLLHPADYGTAYKWLADALLAPVVGLFFANNFLVKLACIVSGICIGYIFLIVVGFWTL